MAFHFTLKDDGTRLETVSNQDQTIAFVDLGYSDDGFSYKIMITLCSVPAMPPGHREVHFVIIEVDDNFSIRKHTNGLSTKIFLVGSNRNDVLEAIALVTARLAKLTECEVLSINTNETYLPEKALKKFDYICAVLCLDGFDGRRVDSFHGQEQWQLKKN